MAWPKGRAKNPASGRKRGQPNKMTATFKAMLLAAQDELGGLEHYLAWAKENPTEHYRIMARLLPQEVAAKVDNSGTLKISWDDGMGGDQEARRKG